VIGWPLILRARLRRLVGSPEREGGIAAEYNADVRHQRDTAAVKNGRRVRTYLPNSRGGIGGA
jgi:hypothetical protein